MRWGQLGLPTHEALRVPTSTVAIDPVGAAVGVAVVGAGVGAGVVGVAARRAVREAARWMAC